MKVSRRRFLRITLGIGLLAASGHILKDIFFPSSLTAGEAATLGAFLDTLIPSDETPGASQLGIAEKLLTGISRDRNYRRTIREGCAWLNRKAKKYGAPDFAGLREQQKEEIVAEAETGPAGSLHRLFFEKLRSEAFSCYYACPETWKTLTYQGPPQPDGYPEYTSVLTGRS